MSSPGKDRVFFLSSNLVPGVGVAQEVCEEDEEPGGGGETEDT